MDLLFSSQGHNKDRICLDTTQKLPLATHFEVGEIRNVGLRESG